MSTPYKNTPTTLVYIAGPYTADSLWQIQNNIDQANLWALHVANASVHDRNMPFRQGHLFYPVVPHNNTPLRWGGAAPNAFFYDGTMKLMEACDICVFFPYHATAKAQSVGTDKELERAREMYKYVIDLRQDENPLERLKKKLRFHLELEYLDRESNYWD